MNLVLVGYRGSGKSVVGQLLARRLGWKFVDLDRLISRQTGRTITEIFARDGEQAFREFERKAVESLRRAKNHVIALGGGTVTDADMKAHVKRLGKVVWLRAPAAVLWSRIARDPHSIATRPALTQDGGLAEIETLLEARESDYRTTANHTIDTMTMSADEVAESIELWFRANDAEIL